MLILQQTFMMLINRIGDGFATIERPDTDGMFIGTIRENARVKCNSSGRPLVNLRQASPFVRFTRRDVVAYLRLERLGDFSQTTDDKLSR